MSWFSLTKAFRAAPPLGGSCPHRLLRAASATDSDTMAPSRALQVSVSGATPDSRMALNVFRACEAQPIPPHLEHTHVQEAAEGVRMALEAEVR